MLKIAFIVLLSLTGCSTTSINKLKQEGERVARERASYDFGCESGKVQVEKLAAKDQFFAKGCGLEAVYKIYCPLGPCHAKAL